MKKRFKIKEDEIFFYISDNLNGVYFGSYDKTHYTREEVEAECERLESKYSENTQKRNDRKYYFRKVVDTDCLIICKKAYIQPTWLITISCEVPNAEQLAQHICNFFNGEKSEIFLKELVPLRDLHSPTYYM